MKLRLNHRLPQTADRRNEYEEGVEEELRKRLVLSGASGILSADGQDVDNDSAACALSVNAQDDTAIDVAAGTVVFPNGEYVDISATDLQAIVLDTNATDGLVIRLQYGVTEDGPLTENPYYNIAALPKTRKNTPAEMLVVETVTAYNALASTVVNQSIVLGVARFDSALLTVDNGRDTYTFSRPWFSYQDTEHRSLVGTGSVTDNNPHGMTLNDLTVGNYTAWQALVGPPSCVLARPNGTGRYPGEICTETLPAAAFATDSTGLITGVAGALYAPLGFWPERLLRASLDSDNNTQIAAWIPRGRNVVACFDPANFSAAADLDVLYTKITAGALPGSMTGLQTLTMGQPTTNELLVAGGNFFTEMVENKVLFTDVGLIPMKFDVLVDSTGRAYKNPDVVYCNTALDTLGTTPQAFTIQPRAATRLRVAISNFNVGYTEVRLLITGTDESGAALTETVTFTGPGTSPQTSFTEVISQRLFTAGVFASLNQIQVTVRNGDGPNTTVTVFAEGIPERPGIQDDLLLATVQWTGSEVTALYGNDPDVALDRRNVTRGGGEKSLSSVHSSLDNIMFADTILGGVPVGVTEWATIAEDFNDPLYMEYPNDFTGVQTSQLPVELTNNSLGIRRGYISRLIPFGNEVSLGSLDALWLRLIPKSMRMFPARLTNLSVTMTLYRSIGAPEVLTGTVTATNPTPPYQVVFSGPAPTGPDWYGVKVEIVGTTPRDLAEVMQGFLFHIRS